MIAITPIEIAQFLTESQIPTERREISKEEESELKFKDFLNEETRKLNKKES